MVVDLTAGREEELPMFSEELLKVGTIALFLLGMGSEVGLSLPDGQTALRFDGTDVSGVVEWLKR